ncbi:MAG: LptF/LptG family permease [Phycisphaerales bacterium]
MTTLDRYIARQYVMNIVILLVLLFSFVLVVDASLNIARYLKIASESPDHPEGLRKFLIALWLFVDLWWPKLLQLFNYLLGLVLVGAMGFTYTHLVRHRELVAALAGGVSMFRLARPVLVVAGAMLLVQVANQEFVIPRIAPLLARDKGDAGRRDFSAFKVPLTPDGQNRVIMAASFDPQSQVMSGFYALERDENGKAKRKIVADSAQWTGRQWKLTGGFARPAGIASNSANDPRVARAEPIAAITSSLDPTTLVANRYRSFSQSLSWKQIGEVLSTPGLSEQVRTQMERIGWGRLSTLCSTMLALVIAMPFFLRREPSNMVIQSLKAAPVALTALLGGVLGAAAPVPTDLLPVWVASFLPVLVLGPLSIAMASGVKT